MRHPHGQRRLRPSVLSTLGRRTGLGARATAVVGSAALLGALGVAIPASAATGQAARPASASHQSQSLSGCHLANGIKHVVQIGFDNVHFFRDNPNVPSDLEMLPNLLNFLEQNGAFLSNNHTPLIAHTGDDLLTTATGLYGDRQGIPIANDYRSYNTDGTTDPATVAWDHGAYAAEIDTNYVGFVGPGVRRLGLDGPAANKGATSSGRRSGLIPVADTHFPGPWTDETDIRPTIMYLTGLRDNYEHDGRVITEILSHPNGALAAPSVTALGECYKQLDSSVGECGAYTLEADTKALESNSPGDSEYLVTDKALRGLDVGRDALAGLIKGELEAAAFGNRPVRFASAQLFACQKLIQGAQHLAASTS